MSYAMQAAAGLGAPLAFGPSSSASGIPAEFFPTQEKNGLFWVSDVVRSQAVQLVGTLTDVQMRPDGFGELVARTTPLATNWVLEELKKGKAVSIAPSVIPGVVGGVAIDAKGSDLAWDTSRFLSGTYAILSSPPALVQDAHTFVAKKMAEGTEPSKPPLPAVVVAQPPVAASSSKGLVGFWDGLSTSAKVGVVAGGVAVVGLLFYAGTRTFRPNARRHVDVSYAFERGWIAAEHGDRRNPYSRGSQAGRAWQKAGATYRALHGR